MLGNKLTSLQIKTLVDIWGDMGEQSHAKISGFSMWPLIKPSDDLTIDYQIRDIKLGEIVIFQSQGKLVAHRVVKRIKEETGHIFCLTKGDRNRQLDHLALPPEAVLGKVMQINGPVKKVNCSSLLWRTLNYLIAIYSYIGVTQLVAASNKMDYSNKLLQLL